MEASLNDPPPAKSGKVYMKAIIFLAFIVTAIVVVKFTPVKEYLTAEHLGRFLEAAGVWAPIVLIAIWPD